MYGVLLSKRLNISKRIATRQDAQNRSDDILTPRLRHACVLCEYGVPLLGSEPRLILISNFTRDRWCLCTQYVSDRRVFASPEMSTG